jgi:hypothetical protein
MRRVTGDTHHTSSSSSNNSNGSRARSRAYDVMNGNEIAKRVKKMKKCCRVSGFAFQKVVSGKDWS